MNFLAELNEIKGMSFNICDDEASEIVGFRQSLRTNEQVANAKEREMTTRGTDILAAEARDRLDAKDREIAHLRGALMAIRDRALGDKAGEHPSQLVRELRSIAATALNA